MASTANYKRYRASDIQKQKQARMEEITYGGGGGRRRAAAGGDGRRRSGKGEWLSQIEAGNQKAESYFRRNDKHECLTLLTAEIKETSLHITNLPCTVNYRRTVADELPI